MLIINVYSLDAYWQNLDSFFSAFLRLIDKVKIMKYYFYLFCTVFALSASAPTLASEPGNSTFYLIRHAEKELHAKPAGKPDPKLTRQGKQRAKNWAKVLQHIKLNHVYSTDTTRTRDTAKPIADSQNLPVELYSWPVTDYTALREKHLGEAVLIVGHSNTSPAFVNGLIGNDHYPDLDESIYGRLYIVDIIGGTGTAKMLTINP